METTGEEYEVNQVCNLTPIHKEADPDGWIPVSMRKPAASDANDNGDVLWCNHGGMHFQAWDTPIESWYVGSYWMPVQFPSPLRKQ